MDEAHQNPAQRLVSSLVGPLLDDVGHALQSLHVVMPDMTAALEAAERNVDRALRKMVAEGKWAAAGISDVRALYDLEVHVTEINDEYHISVRMPFVMRILRAQDDPDAN